MQWNDAGGKILFLCNHCRIVLNNNITDTTYSIDIDSPFAADMPFMGNAESQLQPEAPEPNASNANAEELDCRHQIESTLLHERHLASEDCMCEDTRLGHDPNKFCETCKLTTAMSAHKGKSPLDKHNDITGGLGEELHVDILYNPATRCVIPSLHTKFLLAMGDLNHA
jgi:hypothetical protein